MPADNPPPAGPESVRNLRGPNFTEDESLLLVRLINRNYAALYGEDVQTTSRGARNSVWDEISRRVTAVGFAVRNKDGLQHRYRNLRVQTKKKLLESASDSRAPNLTELEKEVAKNISRITLFGLREYARTVPGFGAIPMITIAPGAVRLPENAPKNTKVPATIATTGSHGVPAIINANPVRHPFTVIPKAANEWELITTNTSELDFEAVSLYSLQLLVKDVRGSSASQLISIQIIDVNEAPVFTGTLAKQETEVYIPEDTVVGTVIYTVAAKDPENDDLQYSISAMVPAGSTDFSIDNNGAISTAKALDYEAGPKSYTITVRVSDGPLDKDGNVKVFLTNVNDNDPVLRCSFSSIAAGKEINKEETSASGNRVEIDMYEELAPGTTVAKCTATDADDMKDLSFRLDPGNPYFTINKETGTVIIIFKMDSEETGFASRQSFSVKVCDKGLRCATIPAIVNILGINDNPPFCAPYLYSFIQTELIKANTLVATLNCQDPDVPPDELTYEPNSGPVGPTRLFQQIRDTPNVIQVTKDLNYDKDPETTYEMMISVSDKNEPPHTVTATVIVSVTPVNDFAPVFSPATYTFTVPETSGAGYVVGTVTATDEDKPHCMRYRIINGDTEIIQLFWINGVTGAIQLMTRPDFETKPQHVLTVEAVDCDPATPRRSKTTVTIDIKEENDEEPVCTPSTYKALILDNVTAGMNINGFRLNCKDRDSPDTAMRFEIVSGNVNNHFTFDPTHGSNNPKFIVKNPFNYDDGTDLQLKYNLVVHVIDDNLKNGKAARVMTGTTLIDIGVVRTNLPVPSPTTNERKGVSVVYETVNTYSSEAWCIPLIFTFLALCLAALLAWSCHLIWRYTNLKECCKRSPRKAPPRRRVKTYQPGPKKEKVDILTEMAKYGTVFDGEAVDPESGERKTIAM